MTPQHPNLSQTTRVFARIGVFSFGGPAAQIALMHRELVDKHQWLTEREYLSALSFCMLLPGPEAMQLATYAGWRLHGTRGGLIAGLLFVLPGAVVVLALAMAYATFGQVPLMQAAFQGVQAAVVVIVIEALLRVARRALKGPAHWGIAAAAFLGLLALNLPFPLIILTAGLVGFLTTHDQTEPAAPRPGMFGQSLRTALIWGGLWLGPLAALVMFENGILAEIALFFSQLAVVTFGGAYAVLAWMAQTVVQDKAWLTLPQMIDALGLAETTPGPLILVTEFVGYLAAHRQGGVWLGVAGAVVTLWMTFTPCFLWVFTGAPYIARLASMPRLSGALAAITAAVVGVIANLSLWFALHVAFGRVDQIRLGPLHLSLPDWGSVNPLSLALTLLAAVMILRLHWGLAATLITCAALAMAASRF
ncbi:MAG: chromate efflux transporter [Paracoccaceae bacterium]|nr:chromate efflux transporter [Paracoccaceae bacterium]